MTLATKRILQIEMGFHSAPLQETGWVPYVLWRFNVDLAHQRQSLGMTLIRGLRQDEERLDRGHVAAAHLQDAGPPVPLLVLV